MTDLDQQLIELFSATATDAEIPPLPLPDILARGQELQRVRRRRAAIWTAAAAAVAVVAVSLALALAGHGSRQAPAPAHHTPPASPSTAAGRVPTTAATLPYLDGHILHLGGKAIPTEANQLLSHGDTTLVWSTSTRQWWQVRDGDVEQISTGRPTKDQPWLGWQSVHLSPDGGTLVVLTHPTDKTTRITSYVEPVGRERGHVDLDQGYANWTGGGDAIEIAGMNDVGQVFWRQQGSDGDTWYLWTPGADPLALRVKLDDGAAYPPHGAIGAAGDLLTIAPDGTVTETGAISDIDSVEPLWSPSGAVVVDGTAGVYAPTITHLDGGTTISPRLPGDFQSWLGFESDTYVLGLVQADGRPSIVRCATDSGACTLVERLPPGSTSWKWATSAPGAMGVTTTPPTSATGLPQREPAAVVSIHAGTLSLNGQPLAEDVTGAVQSGTTILASHGTTRLTVDQVGSNGLTEPPHAPGSVSSAPPAVPYVENGVLHVGGASIGVSGLTRAIASGGTVLAMRTGKPNAAGGSTVTTSLVDGDRLVPVPALTSVGLTNHEDGYAPYLSADGKVAVAMSWRNGTTLRMTAWSVPARRVLGTVDLHDDEIAPEGIAGIERDGTVVYFDPTAQHGYAWRPGRAPRRLDATTSTALKQGAVVVGPADVRVVADVPDGIVGVSPDGTAILTLGRDGTATVRDLTTGTVVPLELPGHVYEPVGFESANAVLLTVGEEQGGPLVRCRATGDGSCTQIWPSTKDVSLPFLRGGY